VVLALVVVMAALSLHSLKQTDTASSHIAQAQEQAASATRWQGLTQLNVNRTLSLAKSGNSADLKAFSDPQMKKTSAEITEAQKALEARRGFVDPSHRRDAGARGKLVNRSLPREVVASSRTERASSTRASAKTCRGAGFVPCT
jgi:hypothetical protein